MKKIERLTPEQEAYLPVFRQEYLDIALNPKRIDPDKLLAAITDAYAHIGEVPVDIDDASERIGWPNEAERKAENQAEYDTIMGRGTKRLNVPKPTGKTALLGAPRLIICDSPYRCMIAIQVLEDKGLSLSDAELEFWVEMYIESGETKKRNMFKSSFLWGSQDMYWIAWGRFAEYIGVEFDATTRKLLDIVERIGRECEWWWPFRHIVVASQKPVFTKWDDENRLHSESGPAIQYDDDYTLMAWHGIRIPREWIFQKQKLTPEVAITWENIEQRRAACELLGWDKVISSLNPKVLDEDPNPEIGTLLEVDIPEIGREKFLRVLCATGRTFCLCVPPDMKTALQANAWTWNLSPSEYDPEVTA